MKERRGEEEEEVKEEKLTSAALDAPDELAVVLVAARAAVEATRAVPQTSAELAVVDVAVGE